MKAERQFPRVVITAKGTRWVEQGHPWIYEGEVIRQEGDCENGGLVDAVSEKDKYLGTGFLSEKSKIRVRLLSRNANDRFDAAFWQRRLQYAWDYRKTVMGDQTSCCRIIFGEADGFPGLTVDRFSDLLVTQTLSIGMERAKDMIFPALVKLLREDGEVIRGVFERNDVAIRELEGMAQNKGWYVLPGETPQESPVTEICENGVYYAVDVENGQKTGFFLDQKYNRLAVATDGTNTWYFQYDTNGSPLGFVLNGTQYFYITNQMNDVLAITDTEGSIVGNYQYDAWGKVLTADTDIAKQNPLRYRGYYYDNETGYYYLQSRYYDSNICRFINADAHNYLDKNIYNGLNLLTYCNNDAVNRLDSNGFYSASKARVYADKWWNKRNTKKIQI